VTPVPGPVLALLLAGPCLAAQDGKLSIEGYVAGRPYLVAGEGRQVRAKPGAGRLVALAVTYRPGSEVEIAGTVAVTPDGTAIWTPARPGLAELDATIAPPGGKPFHYKETVAVRFANRVSVGLFVMIAAGLILFGGAFLSIRALLRRDAGPQS